MELGDRFGFITVGMSKGIDSELLFSRVKLMAFVVSIGAWTVDLLLPHEKKRIERSTEKTKYRIFFPLMDHLVKQLNKI